MNTETVICKLYELRTELGYTQRQVAEGADINIRTLINTYKGHTIPSLLYAMKVADFLRLRVDEIFEYKKKMVK